MTQVVPQFAQFYSGLGAELPAATQLLIEVSPALRHSINFIWSMAVDSFFFTILKHKPVVRNCLDLTAPSEKVKDSLSQVQSPVSIH
jgi:type II secretory pathway component PulF